MARPPQTLRFTLPPAPVAALFHLSAPQRRDVRTVLGHIGRQAERMAESLARDGALLQRTLMEIQQENAALAVPDAPATQGAMAAIVRRHGLPRRWLVSAADGWNLYLVQQRPRDARQVETMLLQSAVAPLRIIGAILGLEQNDQRGTELLRELGLGIGSVQLLQHLAAGLDWGRIHFPETEMERFGVSAVDLAERRRTAKFLDLCWFQAKQARGHLTAAEEGLEALPADNARSCARTIIAWQRLVLDRMEAAEWDLFGGRSFEPGRLESARLAFEARRRI